jgi:hypothetical protein
VLVLPSAWVARTVAGIALIAGTALVIRTERRRHTRSPRRHRRPSGAYQRELSDRHGPPERPR